MRPPRLLIFDLDGTLLDTAQDLARSVNAALAQTGFPALEIPLIRSYIGNGSLKLIARCLGSAHEHLLPEVHQRFMAHYSQNCLLDTRPYPGVLDFLGRNQLPAALVTNKPLAPTQLLLKHFALDSRLSPVLGGDNTPARKPAPDGLLHIAQTLGYAPSETWMIGDDTPDMEAARAAGMTSIALLSGFGSAEKILGCRPDAVFPDFPTLAEFLDSMPPIPVSLEAL